MSGKNYKVLVVDDSEINRTILNEILRSEYEIIEAESGEEALDVLQKNKGKIALVLLDVVMPGKDGFDVLGAMNRYGIIEDIPVIMISAESSPDFICMQLSCKIRYYESHSRNEAQLLQAGADNRNDGE